MKNIILYDIPAIHTALLPITFTRPISYLLTGLFTIRQKWEKMLPGTYSCATTDYLSAKYPTIESPDADNLIITSHILPTEPLISATCELRMGEAITDNNGNIIARRGALSDNPSIVKAFNGTVKHISRITDLFTYNAEILESDFDLLTSGRISQPISETNTVIGDKSRIFIEEGATVEGAFLNASKGSIYIGRNAEIMEGSCIRGSFGLLDHSVVNMGSKIYGATTIGQHCKVGGELNNVVMIGFSNKAHDGFLGNAVIGEWCNLGAGCVASNLKNDYTEIKLWDYSARRFLRTGLQFCGLIMGDHSKAGINTMLNTATVIGVGVNIHGSGFPRNFIPSFSEGSSTGFSDVPLSKFFDIARRVMARRNVELSDEDIEMYTTLHNLTDSFR